MLQGFLCGCVWLRNTRQIFVQVRLAAQHTADFFETSAYCG